MTARAGRGQHLREAFYNLFLLNDENAIMDIFTNSGATARNIGPPW
jgi:tryptophanase